MAQGELGASFHVSVLWDYPSSSIMVFIILIPYRYLQLEVREDLSASRFKEEGFVKMK